jgi:cell volume regulation protein A
MNISIELILVIFSAITLLSVLVSKISDKVGIPTLLLFLVVGILAGSEGIGGIYYDDPLSTQWVAMIALAVILFSGGVDTEWKGIKPILKEGILLATVGVLLTASFVGVFVHYVLGLDWQVSFLLGAIASSTDAAAVFSVLRSKGVALKGRLKPLLELESGSNDPMAVFLTIGMVQIIQMQVTSPAQLVLLFIMQMGIGAVLGWLMSRIALYLINRLRLGYEGLYPVLIFAIVILTFGLSALLKGSGYLSVYVLGLLLGKVDFLHKRSLLRFFDGNAWLMQIVLFVTLGLLVFPSQVIRIAGPGLLLSLALILLARPLSIFISLAPFKYSIREKLFISWVGLKGAVPIVLATFPLVAGIGQAQEVFNLVFFVVISSVLLQGSLIPQMARWLKVDAPSEQGPKFPIEMLAAPGIKPALKEIEIAADSQAEGKAIYELGLPLDYLIIMIRRDEEYIQPNGSIVLQTGDILLSLSEEKSYQEARLILTSKTGQQPSLL